MLNWSAKELRWFPCMSIAFISCSCHAAISRVSNIIPFELASIGLSELIHQTVFCLASFLLTLWTLNFLIELHVALVACGVWRVECGMCVCVLVFRAYQLWTWANIVNIIKYNALHCRVENHFNDDDDKDFIGFITLSRLPPFHCPPPQHFTCCKCSTRMQKVFQLKSSRQRRRRGQAVRCWGVSEQAHDMPRIAATTATTTKEITTTKTGGTDASIVFHFVLLFAFAIAIFPLLPSSEFTTRRLWLNFKACCHRQ